MDRNSKLSKLTKKKIINKIDLLYRQKQTK